MNAADRKTDREAARATAIRASRTAALARRGTAARAAGTTRTLLVCACGSERFGLPLADTARVLARRACTPVPGAMPAILGLVALSGRIVSVVGLARALGRPGAGAAEDGHLVLLRAAVTPIALAVDRVLGVAHLVEDPDGAVGGFGSDAVSRYAPAEHGSAGLGDFVVIDLPRLLRRTLP